MTATCRNGHPQTPETTTTDTQGRRICKVCSAEAQRRYYAKAKAEGRLPPRKPGPPRKPRPRPSRAKPKPEGLELWRMAHGFENWVAASTRGRFRSLRTGKIITLQPQRNGHLQVRFRILGGVKIWFSAPATMLRTFTRDRQPGEIPVFLDGDRTNLALQNLRWGKQPGNRAKRAPRVVLPPIGEALRASLNENAIYAAAHAAVPRTLPPHARDDVISDIMVAVLAGELALADVPSKADSFRRAHNRQFNLRGHVSIDDEAHSWRGYGAIEAGEYENESGVEA